MPDIKGFPMYVTNNSETQSWCNSTMGDTNAFVASLQNFPKDNITDGDCELLAPYIESVIFTVDMTAKTSSLVIGLCKWATDMKTCHEIARVVMSKMHELRVKESELATTNK
jgi:hypothetical protein